MMLAASGPPAMVGGPLGITFNTLGATPNEHCSVAPATTCVPIVFLSNIFAVLIFAGHFSVNFDDIASDFCNAITLHIDRSCTLNIDHRTFYLGSHLGFDIHLSC